jgi:NAD(P)-dependent dehydrogenase (short-subunit alcohol dehydrogenase family)
VNGALEAALRPLAAELAPIRVNAVSPGVIDTPGWGTVPAEQRDRLFEDLAGRLPASRVGRPEEIADAVMMLIGNGYITGHTIVADGGLHLARG